MKKENRFITTEIYHDAMAACTKLIVDKETKVQYLFHNEGNASGFCILVDSNGLPLLAEGTINEHIDVKNASNKKESPMAEINPREDVEPLCEFKSIEVIPKPKKSWSEKIK